MLLSCVVLGYAYDFIFGQWLFRACVVCLIFMPNQNGFFLSYLMLVPVLNIQYKFLTANISSTELFTEYTLTIKQHKSHAKLQTKIPVAKKYRQCSP
jgi:hypothetical protein